MKRVSNVDNSKSEKKVKNKSLRARKNLTTKLTKPSARKLGTKRQMTSTDKNLLAASPVAVIDWGIGGLSVLKPLKAKYPQTNFLYFSDSGFLPYGKVSEKKLIQRLSKLIQLFKSKKIYTVIVACNAASTVLPQLRRKFPNLKLFGMLEAGAQTIRHENFSDTLVLGGKRTIESNYFQKTFKDSKYEIQTVVAQPLSALIEKGHQKSKKFISEIKKIKQQCLFMPSSVLLACTHYPAATSEFRKIFKSARILDPAVTLVNSAEIEKILQTNKSTSRGLVLYLTTGSVTESNTAAKAAFKIKAVRFQPYPLSL